MAAALVLSMRFHCSCPPKQHVVFFCRARTAKQYAKIYEV